MLGFCETTWLYLHSREVPQATQKSNVSVSSFLITWHTAIDSFKKINDMLVVDDFSFLGCIFFKWCYFFNICIFCFPRKKSRFPGALLSVFSVAGAPAAGNSTQEAKFPRESKASGESGGLNSKFTPLQKANSSHLKIDGRKMYFPLKRSLSRISPPKRLDVPSLKLTQ